MEWNDFPKKKWTGSYQIKTVDEMVQLKKLMALEMVELKKHLWYEKLFHWLRNSTPHDDPLCCTVKKWPPFHFKSLWKKKTCFESKCGVKIS